MSKLNSKALGPLRQKVRKYNKDFDAELNSYRDGPDPLGYSSGAAEDYEDIVRKYDVFLKTLICLLSTFCRKMQHHCLLKNLQQKRKQKRRLWARDPTNLKVKPNGKVNPRQVLNRISTLKGNKWKNLENSS
jgi:hypothetical protein